MARSLWIKYWLVCINYIIFTSNRGSRVFADQVASETKYSNRLSDIWKRCPTGRLGEAGFFRGHPADVNSGDNPDTEITAAIDGDLNTFIDGATSSGHVGYDFGSGNTAVPTKFRYAPRRTDPGRMVGGELRASNDADYLNNFTLLHTIEAEPKDNDYTEDEIIDSTDYRYIYYFSPNGYCNVSEVEFYGLSTN